ncbi:hypothetical protein BST61_g2224 [Cercospora zeina]
MASAREPDSTASSLHPVQPIAPPPLPAPDSTDLRKTQGRPRRSRPPTEGGGPLSSHPTFENPPAAWPPTPDSDLQHKPSCDTPSNTRSRNDSFTERTSPAVAPSSTTHTYSTTTNTDPTTTAHMDSTHDGQHQRPGTVRRMFSLSSLRQSFSSSRTSFSQRPDTSHGSYHAPYPNRAESPTDTPSTTTPMAPPAPVRLSNERRPAALPHQKRSSSWFKRKSHLFGMNDDGTLDVLDEDGPEHKKFKDNQLPTLPEIGSLGGGRLDGGSIGWDEQLFTTN